MRHLISASLVTQLTRSHPSIPFASAKPPKGPAARSGNRRHVSSQKNVTAEVSSSALLPLHGDPQRPHGASPSTLLFLQTKLSKSRKPIPPPEPPSSGNPAGKTSPPGEDRKPPGRSITQSIISRPQHDSRLSRPSTSLVGNAKPQSKDKPNAPQPAKPHIWPTSYPVNHSDAAVAFSSSGAPAHGLPHGRRRD